MGLLIFLAGHILHTNLLECVARFGADFVCLTSMLSTKSFALKYVFSFIQVEGVAVSSVSFSLFHSLKGKTTIFEFRMIELDGRSNLNRKKDAALLSLSKKSSHVVIQVEQGLPIVMFQHILIL